MPKGVSSFKTSYIVHCKDTGNRILSREVEGVRDAKELLSNTLEQHDFYISGWIEERRSKKLLSMTVKVTRAAIAS